MRTSSQAKSHNDYTVGWICALSKEMTAARAMLDEEHPPLPKPVHDANTYVLGSIGEHNVVIACLPDGIMGTNQAAITATRMVNTFPSIKAGLMVGIGGGVPPSVKLGDVVVSRPADGNPGVVQWDFGKAEAGGKFRQIGVLNKPPCAMLTALSCLRSEHALRETKISEYLEAAKTRYPNLASAYQRPRPHRGIKRKMASTGPEEVVDEPQQKTEGVAIHYGLIASGNQVVKDAVLRDRLNERFNGKLLCVEMEAAGLMNDFPCVVIRGIVDFADENKNDGWQEYGAAVAAAYAKELLGCLQVIEVKNESSIKDVMLDQIYDNVSRMAARLEELDDRKVLEWLTNFQYASHHNDVVQNRQPGTGQWLLNSTEYYRWLQDQGQILFCLGMPGAGKTFLTSIVIDHLFWLFDNTQEVGIAYIYFNYKYLNEHTTYNLLASILQQLACRQFSLPESLRKLYDHHKDKKTIPSVNEIVKTLKEITSSYSRAFVVIDALDECENSDYTRNSFLSKLFGLCNECNMNIFATSRHIQNIIEQFKNSKSTTLEIRAHEEDLRRYLDERIQQSGRELLRKRREAIKAQIVKAVDGMFLLAQLYFQSIETQTSPKRLNLALESLVTGGKGQQAYNLAYDEAMNRIESQNTDYRRLAQDVLSWVVCAERPLTTLELQHALAVEADIDLPELEENFPEISDLVSVCAGLVTIDEASDAVRLIHYTTQEYFNQSRWDQWIRESHQKMAESCILYLSFESFDRRSGKSSRETFEENLAMSAATLYSYVAKNWGHHVRKSSENGTESIFLDFLKDQNRGVVHSEALELEDHLNSARDSPISMTPLHIAAYFGLRQYVNHLLSEGADIHAIDAWNLTPLLWASINDHADVAELLIEAGSNMEAADLKHGKTSLLWAATRGHIAMAELLVKKGADIEKRDGTFMDTPLALAAGNGCFDIAKLLIQAGANIETKDFLFTRTPLWFAAERGDLAIMELLLNSGTKIEATHIMGIITLLTFAMDDGHLDAAELLLKYIAEE